MIRVTVEFVEYGDETRTSILDVVTITNDGTGTKERGNYSIRSMKRDFSLRGHERAAGFWPLLARVAKRLAP